MHTYRTKIIKMSAHQPYRTFQLNWVAVLISREKKGNGNGNEIWKNWTGKKGEKNGTQPPIITVSRYHTTLK